MNAKLNNRLTLLEASLSPKAGIADTIRQCHHERLEGLAASHVSSGPVAEAILNARAERKLKGE